MHPKPETFTHAAAFALAILAYALIRHVDQVAVSAVVEAASQNLATLTSALTVR